MDIKKLSKMENQRGGMPMDVSRPTPRTTPEMQEINKLIEKHKMENIVQEQKKQQETMLRLEALRLACSLPHEKSEEVLVTANSFMIFLNNELT